VRIRQADRQTDRQTDRQMDGYCVIYIVTYTGCGSVTNNTTKVRIGYRIYSLWRFTAAHITITSY
jgi:hypothetical protein